MGAGMCIIASNKMAYCSIAVKQHRLIKKKACVLPTQAFLYVHREGQAHYTVIYFAESDLFSSNTSLPVLSLMFF